MYWLFYRIQKFYIFIWIYLLKCYKKIVYWFIKIKMRLTNRQKFWVLCVACLLILIWIIYLLTNKKENWPCQKWMVQSIENYENWNVKSRWCITENWEKMWKWYYYREDSSLEKMWTYMNDKEEWAWYTYMKDGENIAIVEDFREGQRDWKSIAYSDFENWKKSKEFSYSKWILSGYFADYYEDWNIKKEWTYGVVVVNWRSQWKYNWDIKYYKEDWSLDYLETYDLWKLISK